MHLKFLALSTLLLFTLSGCARWVAPLSQEPIEDNYSLRTDGQKVDDNKLERQLLINILRNNPAYSESNINITSYNGFVLLTGQVPNNNLKTTAESIATKARRSRKVFNELTVTENIVASTQAHDQWLSTKINARFLLNPDVPSKSIQVVIEDGVVYLMGLVTHEQANYAIDSIRPVQGISKIIKIFEYI